MTNRKYLKGDDMTKNKSGRPVRKFMTRMLATGALLSMYALGTLGVTSVVMTAGMSTAVAQRGRGRGRGGYRGRGNYGAAIGAGVAVGVIGGMIAADQARRYNSAVEYCMQRFRSYNPETGTYIGFDGRERPCP